MACDPGYRSNDKRARRLTGADLPEEGLRLIFWRPRRANWPWQLPQPHFTLTFAALSAACRLRLLSAIRQKVRHLGRLRRRRRDRGLGHVVLGGTACQKRQEKDYEKPRDSLGHDHQYIREAWESGPKARMDLQVCGLRTRSGHTADQPGQCRCYGHQRALSGQPDRRERRWETV